MTGLEAGLCQPIYPGIARIYILALPGYILYYGLSCGSALTFKFDCIFRGAPFSPSRRWVQCQETLARLDTGRADFGWGLSRFNYNSRRVATYEKVLRKYSGGHFAFFSGVLV